MILQVYTPTTDTKEEDIEKFYADFQQTIDQASTQNTILIAVNFKSQVSAVEDPPVVGKFGLGD